MNVNAIGSGRFLLSVQESRSTQGTEEPFFYQYKCLMNWLGGEEGGAQAISLLRKDRLQDGNAFTAFLKEKIGGIVEGDPLLMLLTSILEQGSSKSYREQAADAYIAEHPEDERFEKAYAYLKTPHILVGHLLIVSGLWKCANPDNSEFYDEQMAGLFQGTVAFDKGDRLSREELEVIQKREGERPRYPIADKLKEKDGAFEVIGWCSTPPMCETKSRLDDLFIEERRKEQDAAVASYVDSLKETSKILETAYELPIDETAVIAVIGPYGAGKSVFIDQKFSGENISAFSLDQVNEFLKGPGSREQDHHFEAMMVKDRFRSEACEIPVLLTETAAIDAFRFNRLVKRDFSDRQIIMVEEIAPEHPSEAVDCCINRDRLTDLSRMGTAATCAKDALKYRLERIKEAQEDPKIAYTLYCGKLKKGGQARFIEVARVEKGELTIVEGQERLYNTLTKVL